jgi:hypothetical protein
MAMRLSSQALHVWIEEGWDIVSLLRRSRGLNGRDPLKVRKHKFIHAIKEICGQGWAPPDFLLARMSTAGLLDAWERACSFGFKPRRGLGSPYENYQARLVAGAILTDRQMRWLARCHEHNPRAANWCVLGSYRQRKISWSALRSVWLFGTTRSKRHQILATRWRRRFTPTTLCFARDPRAKKMTTMQFWQMVQVTQLIDERKMYVIAEIVENAFERGLDGLMRYLDPITLLASLAPTAPTSPATLMSLSVP